ncbi:NADPH-dependent F420 reductase [Streptomyces sp. NPDC005355]|uniref:NADPH-dependent F420 reductase n=1 Tax=Streptomyces sp. NPDC005355 TaxID=3157038 RepID=UPI0033B25CD9
MQSQTYSIGVIGGTGPQGKGLAYRFARAGHRVFLGSRSPERAQEAAQELGARLRVDRAVTGTSNATAAEVNDVVVLAVPWNGHAELVEGLRDELAGKIVISCVNPLGFDKRGPYGLPVSQGSAAEQAAALLPGSRVVGAFHHVSAVSLLGDAEYLKDEDVLVCGDDAAAKGVVQELVRTVTGRTGVDAGALRLARQLEPLTAVLISINKKYKTHSGLAVTGLTRSH